MTGIFLIMLQDGFSNSTGEKVSPGKVIILHGSNKSLNDSRWRKRQKANAERHSSVSLNGCVCLPRPVRQKGKPVSILMRRCLPRILNRRKINSKYTFPMVQGLEIM